MKGFWPIPDSVSSGSWISGGDILIANSLLWVTYTCYEMVENHQCGPPVSVVASEECTSTIPDYSEEFSCASQYPDAGTSAPLGTTVITITAGNDTNNASCTISYTVVDQSPPVISSCAPSKIISVDSTCKAVLPSFMTETIASDTCGGSITFSQSIPVGTLMEKGTTPITIYVTDEAGNSDSCTSEVIVIDDTEPTLSCPQDIAYDACILQVDLIPEANVTDNCPGVRITQTPDTTTLFSLGNHTIAINATDADGNFATCETKISVFIANPPQLQYCRSVYLNADSECVAFVPGNTFYNFFTNKLSRYQRSSLS